MYNKIIILIPTFNPTNSLNILIDKLKQLELNNIIIVNDGSINDKELYKLNGVKIIGYGINRGKGYALKYGFDYIKRLDIDGVITIDDDLQHAPEDVKKIIDHFLLNKEVYLGIRSFDKAPFIRKKANLISSYIFKILYKKDIPDTQTGLRCFPKKILSSLIKVKGNGFEYEMNVLKYLVKTNTNINFVKIDTIYNKNKSHFKAFKDSFNILKAIIKK